MYPSESVQFAESPRSPFRKSKSHRDLSASKPVTTNRKCGAVGSLSAVNSHMSEEGLLRLAPIQPLVSERAITPTTPEAIRRMKRKSKVESVPEPEESALIELAKYPGYSSNKFTLLPHGLDTLQQMILVTKAQSNLQKQPTFLIHWNKLFNSDYSQNILLDLFWWFFLHYYQPDQRIQNLLFARISENYVLFLTTTAMSKHHDVFFKMYPDILAQAIYSSYIHSFPTSWNSFDDEFKNELCDIVSLWFKGIKPIPKKWKEWNFKALEPKNLMKHMSESDTDDTRVSSSTKGFDVIQLIDEAKQKESTDKNNATKKQTIIRKRSIDITQTRARKPTPTKIPIKGPEFEHSVIDVYCNSPLVIHFLQTQGLLRNIGYSLLIQHTSVIKLPDKDCQTYYDVIKKSARQDKIQYQDFCRNYSIVKQHMNKHSRERYKNYLQHDRYVRLLLSHPREVRQLSSNLVFYTLAKHPAKFRREKLTSAIQEAMQRL